MSQRLVAYHPGRVPPVRKAALSLQTFLPAMTAEVTKSSRRRRQPGACVIAGPSSRAPSVRGNDGSAEQWRSLCWPLDGNAAAVRASAHRLQSPPSACELIFRLFALLPSADAQECLRRGEAGNCMVPKGAGAGALPVVGRSNCRYLVRVRPFIQPKRIGRTLSSRWIRGACRHARLVWMSSEPACRARACDRLAGGPSAANHDRTGTASCGSERRSLALAGCAAGAVRQLPARRVIARPSPLTRQGLRRSRLVTSSDRRKV